MVLRVKPTTTRFPTSILSTQVDSTLLHSIPSVWCGDVVFVGLKQILHLYVIAAQEHDIVGVSEAKHVPLGPTWAPMT